MLTIVSIPKPFAGHSGIIQRNALKSWARLGHGTEIILFGSDKGIAEAAAEQGVRHIAEIDTNEYGTPYLSSVFSRIADSASHETICFVNSDIIFIDDFIPTIRKISKKNNFIVGRRTNISVREDIDMTDPEWQHKLRSQLDHEGLRQGPNAIDYFVFHKRESILNIPAFLIGRPAWDNWFISNAKRNGLRIVDATYSISCIHQNHDYSHVKARRGNSWEGPEGDYNRKLAGGVENIASVYDASYVAIKKFLLPALGCRYAERKLGRLWARRK